MYNKRIKQLMISTGISGMIAVMLGALGAHKLQDLLSPDSLAAFKTGVYYQLFHTVALLAVLIWAKLFANKKILYAAYFFIVGIVLFSGSIYLLSTLSLHQLNWVKIFGPITPLGGIAFILAWFFVVLAAFEISDTK